MLTTEEQAEIDQLRAEGHPAADDAEAFLLGKLPGAKIAHGYKELTMVQIVTFDGVTVERDNLLSHPKGHFVQWLLDTGRGSRQFEFGL